MGSGWVEWVHLLLVRRDERGLGISGKVNVVTLNVIV